MIVYTLIDPEKDVCITSTTLEDIAPAIDKTANAIRILFSRHKTSVLKGRGWFISKTELQRIKGRGRVF